MVGGSQDFKQNKQMKRESCGGVLNDIFIISCYTSCPSEKLSKVWQRVQYILKKKS